jgi:two-component system cell cycle response regulator
MNNSLQSENFSLRQQMETLLYEARCNEDKMRRFDLLERRLIGAGSLLELVRLLLAEYKLAFAVEFVTLALVDRDYEATRILENGFAADTAYGGLTLLPSASMLVSLYGDQRHPRLGAFDPAQHQALFNAPSGAIASLALLPLARQGELIGSLHFGSANAERYVSDCGTAFLERLAEIIAICLESALAQERLKQVGLTDALTGVQNRRYFEHRCPVEIAQARRYKHPLACMFLDIDKFKRINDTYGHQTGDDVLRSVAGLIQSQLRSGDTIARYGGEEFVVLLPQSELHHACQIAERIRCAIEATQLPLQSGQQVRMSISIGLAMLPGKNSAADTQQLAADLVAAADKALYQAKHKGRNRVEWVECVERAGSLSASPARHASPGPLWPPFVAGLRSKLVALAGRMLKKIRRA